MKELGAIVMEAYVMNVYSLHLTRFILSYPPLSMASGLDMTPGEWEEFKSKTNDSFWYVRVIGYPPLPADHDGISCGAHK